jgi:hypothetical protein
MNKLALENYLSKHHSLKATTHLASQIVDENIPLKDVIDLCFHKNIQIGFRAAWCLEFVEVLSPKIFLPFVNIFIRVYPDVKNESVQRHFSKIMMRLTSKIFMSFYRLKPEDFENVLEISFEWLLNPKTPIAVQSNVMQIIFQLSDYQDWIKDELKIILEQKLLSNSAGLISKSKHLLKKMK